MLNLLRRHDQPLAPPTVIYVQVTFSSTTGNCLLAFVYGLTGLFFALACLWSSSEKMIVLSTLEHQGLLSKDLTFQPFERYVMSFIRVSAVINTAPSWNSIAKGSLQ